MASEGGVKGLDAAERAAGLERMRAYIVMLQGPLRLQQWEIYVADEPPQNDEWEADCGTHRRQWRARVRFGDRALAAAPEHVRTLVIHELLHIHTDGWDNAATDARGVMDATSAGWVKERHDEEHEKLVDALSRVLAPLLPLPPTEEERAA